METTPKSLEVCGGGLGGDEGGSKQQEPNQA